MLRIDMDSNKNIVSLLLGIILFALIASLATNYFQQVNPESNIPNIITLIFVLVYLFYFFFCFSGGKIPDFIYSRTKEGKEFKRYYAWRKHNEREYEKEFMKKRHSLFNQQIHLDFYDILRGQPWPPSDKSRMKKIVKLHFRKKKNKECHFYMGKKRCYCYTHGQGLDCEILSGDDSKILNTAIKNKKGGKPKKARKNLTPDETMDELLKSKKSS